MAGMVKKENIRYTHFSRNPKIAAFLKDYGYVKEYGEGVDRMCKELEAIGLPDPMFNDNTFILKTTVMSAFFEGKSTGEASIGFKNALIRHNHASIQPENASIEQNDASIQPENASIEQSDASIRSGNASFHGKERLIEKLCQGKDDGEISARNAADARAVIENVDVMQVITSKEVMRILSCQTTKARLVIKMLEKQGLIKAIQGKGKYILNVTGGAGEKFGT